MAPNAIKFSRLTSLPVFCTADLEKFYQDMTENKHGAFVIDGSKPLFDPVTNGIFVFAEQAGDLFYRVAAVNLDEAGIRVTFSHELSHRSNVATFGIDPMSV